MYEYRKFVCNECDAIVYIKKVACQNAINIVGSCKNRETGGILIGSYSSCLRKVYINEICFEPSDSKSGFSWFVRGIKGLGELLKKKWELNQEYYLGEWHYHPANVPKPSSIDHSQLKSISKDRRFNCKEPVMLIISKNPSTYDFNIYLLIGTRVYEYKESKEF